MVLFFQQCSLSYVVFWVVYLFFCVVDFKCTVAVKIKSVAAVDLRVVSVRPYLRWQKPQSPSAE